MWFDEEKEEEKVEEEEPLEVSDDEDDEEDEDVFAIDLGDAIFNIKNIDDLHALTLFDNKEEWVIDGDNWEEDDWDENEEEEGEKKWGGAVFISTSNN